MKFFKILICVVLAGLGCSAGAAPVKLFPQTPEQITDVAPGVILVDFERVAFGNLRLSPPAGATNVITVRFGEALANGRINRHPPGSVRC